MSGGRKGNIDVLVEEKDEHFPLIKTQCKVNLDEIAQITPFLVKFSAPPP